MYLTISKARNHRYLCVSKSVRVAGTSKRVIVENLGTIESIMQAHSFSMEAEAIEWAKQYVRELNDKVRAENEEVQVKLYPNRTRNLGDKSKVRKLGYLILQKMYYELGLNLICDEIQKRHKVDYDLNKIMESLLYASMISLDSKLGTSEAISGYYNWDKPEPNQIYLSLPIFAKEMDYIQSQLFKNSRKIIDRDSAVVYYNRFDFFMEAGQSEGLEQHVDSREHRTDQLVGLGLFMDRNGYPLAFCFHEWNKSETQAMTTLEMDVIKECDCEKIILCTDVTENNIFNSAGERHFVTIQPVKKLSKEYTDWALDPNGWRKYVHISETDTEEEKARKLAEIKQKRTYNINEIDEDEYKDAIFFKRTPFDKDIKYEKKKKMAIDQMLYVTYSIKYKRFLHAKREERIKRCDPLEKHSSHDYKRLTGKTISTKEGGVAEIVEYYIDQETIEDKKRYDGFYGISSDMNGSVGIVMNALKNKWEIEESLRIMKTDFQGRPVYVSRDDRIKAHFLTCYLTLFLYRFLEKHYLKEKYTADRIIKTIREMDGAVVEGTTGSDGINPLFEYDECCQALCLHTGVMLNKSYLLDKFLTKVIRKVKHTPDKVKRLFEANKRPIGRPNTGDKAKQVKKKGNKNGSTKKPGK